MRIVLDTNVLVSGLLTPFGPSAQIVRMAASGRLAVCYDARILTEYEEVLRRPKFAFPKDAVAALLEQIEDEGVSIVAVPLAEALPDRDDEPFLEVARAAGAEAIGDSFPLIAGNLKHYPKGSRGGVTVVSPRFFVDHFDDFENPARG